MKDCNTIKTFDELIEFEHGNIGSESRNKYEEGAQMFIVSEMLKSTRKEANMTQEQFNSEIDEAMEDSAKGRLIKATDLKAKIQKWE